MSRNAYVGPHPSSPEYVAGLSQRQAERRSGRPAQPLKPFRIECHFCLAAEDMADATERWEALGRAAEALGLIDEGGAVGAMAEADVIEDSPLEHALAESSD